MKKLRIVQASIGGLLLLCHLLINGFSLNSLGIVIYVLVILGIAMTTTTGKAILRYYQGISTTRHELKELIDDAKHRQEWYQRYPWVILVPIAMEGIYALPLLYLGITPLSVLGFALAYAIPMRYQSFDIEMWINSFLRRILITLIVLPFGIEATMIGAGVSQVVGMLGTAWVVKKYHPIDKIFPRREPQGKRLLKGRNRK
jgi:hypothetical protein